MPETIRVKVTVDTSAIRLTVQAEVLREQIRRFVGLTALDHFDEFLAALAARQREAVREALANWGGHAPGCVRVDEDHCSCQFDQALDRLAPKEGW